MGYIAEFAISAFSAGHGDKVTIVPLNNLDIVDHKLIVEGNGNHCLHSAC
jgi:hypothetical protein